MLVSHLRLSAPCLLACKGFEHPPIDPSILPSSPVSTTWDSRSSRKTNLPPCSARASVSLLCFSLVHSPEAAASPLSQQNSGSEERGQPTPLQLSSSLNQCHSSWLAPPVLPSSSSLLLFLWAHRFLFGSAYSCCMFQPASSALPL